MLIILFIFLVRMVGILSLGSDSGGGVLGQQWFFLRASPGAHLLNCMARATGEETNTQKLKSYIV